MPVGKPRRGRRVISDGGRTGGAAARATSQRDWTPDRLSRRRRPVPATSGSSFIFAASSIASAVSIEAACAASARRPPMGCFRLASTPKLHRWWRRWEHDLVLGLGERVEPQGQPERGPRIGDVSLRRIVGGRVHRAPADVVGEAVQRRHEERAEEPLVVDIGVVEQAKQPTTPAAACSRRAPGPRTPPSTDGSRRSAADGTTEDGRGSGRR